MEGSGIYCNEASPSLNGLIVTSNLSSLQGGGIYFHKSNSVLNNMEIRSAAGYYNVMRFYEDGQIQVSLASWIVFSIFSPSSFELRVSKGKKAQIALRMPAFEPLYDSKPAWWIAKGIAKKIRIFMLMILFGKRQHQHR